MLDFELWLVEAMTDMREASIPVLQKTFFVELYNTATNNIRSIWPRIQVMRFTLSS